MKVLACHNFYQQPGGEDQVFADETALLRGHGHEVVPFTLHNDCINKMRMRSLQLAGKTIWNGSSAAAVRKLIQHSRPDVMYCTNTFPLISSSVYSVARDAGVPVVQGLHNFRGICPKAQLTRNDRPCEACLGKGVAWPGLLHRCYRDSFSATAVVVAMSAYHRVARVASSLVDCFVIPTRFAKQKYVAGGFPAERIVVKPNFVSVDNGVGSGRGRYCVFVGRLSREKGVETLLSAWTKLAGDFQLRIVGDGPLSDKVRAACAADPRIRWVGRKPLIQVLEIVGQASALIMPSTWYETFGRTIIEAFSTGTPVIASRLGAMAELVSDGQTGLLFEPGDADALAGQVTRIVKDPKLRARMGRQARRDFESNYTAAINYRLLMSTFERVLSRDRSATPATPEVAV